MTTPKLKQDFDPNGPAGANSGLFGLNHSASAAKLIIMPVPWEATTSYGGGASKGPNAILEASHQVDLFDLELGKFYEAGIHLLGVSKEIKTLNRLAKPEAQKIIKAGGVVKTKTLKAALKKVNDASEKVNQIVYKETKKFLSQGTCFAVLGGDHSSPLGAIKAYVEAFPEMGILHFDAHADLRNAYEGFTYSHASIMYNVLNMTPVKKITQVGIRDFCEEEFDLIKANSQRIETFFDEQLANEKHQGVSWQKICDRIVASLPKEVFVSFDIDGLNPTLCPHTGTPVPGGLEFQEALTLIKTVVRSGRQIIGFDLNEVAPPEDNSTEWDANVGARLLFKLCGWTLKSLSL